MKKFAVGIVGFAMLVALAAPRGGNSALGDEAAADGQELDAWEQAALEAREGRSPGSRRPAVSTKSDNGGSIQLQRQANGHFFATARVQGRDVEFLVDTGATLVALSEEDARRAGISFNRSNFTVIGSGASGPVRGQFVRIKQISLGGKSLSNIEAAVIEGADMSLLGQSFLSRMGKVEMAGDTMTIQ